MRKRKFVENHWLVFAVQGVIGLLFGWFVIFTGISTVSQLIPIVATILLALGIIDLVNLLHRERQNAGWGLTLVLALIELVVALTLLFTLGQPAFWHLIVVACYTIVRGLFEILIGFHYLTDATDRFMWIVCGICGCILGFVILNSGQFVNTTTFIKFFGTYMMIYGITNLIYGVHNKFEREEEREARRKQAEKRRKMRLKGAAGLGILAMIKGKNKHGDRKSAKK